MTENRAGIEALWLHQSSNNRHVARGGSEGADEPPFFTDQKKKRGGQWCPRLAAAHACGTGTVCTAAGL